MCKKASVVVVLVVSLATGVFWASSAAVAVETSVTNYSFETNSVADGSTSSSHSGWTSYSGDIYTWNPTSTSFAGADGSGSLPSPALGAQCLWFDSSSEGIAYQYFLGYEIEADKVYTLTAAVGAPSDKTLDYFGLILSLTSGDIADTNGAVTSYADLGTFADVSASFNTGAGGRTDLIGTQTAFILELVGKGVAIDNVRLDVSAVPEPGTMAMLIGGLIGASVYWWKRRKA
jgi:hypothetical protein